MSRFRRNTRFGGVGSRAGHGADPWPHPRALQPRSPRQSRSLSGRARRRRLAGSEPDATSRSPPGIRARCSPSWHGESSPRTPSRGTSSSTRCVVSARRWLRAAALGRRCIGVELEERWVAITRANLRLALSARQRRLAAVHRGDARSLEALLRRVRGRADLVVLSPPYSCDAGVIDKPAWLRGKRLCDAATLNYASDPDNIGHARSDAYRSSMAEVYAQCCAILRPSGLLITVTKNMRSRGRLLDLASITIQLAHGVGFGYLQHNIALHAAVRDGELVARPSFWQLDQTLRARRAGIPLHLIAHEDVLVFRKDDRRG